MKILVLNGVNLDMLGKRNPTFYGSLTLKQLNAKVKAFAKGLGAKAIFAHSNCEGKLVDILHRTKCDAVLFNPGAYTHYSYALRDAIECMSVPVVEVHLSNVMEREPFRKIDVIEDVVAAKFYGKKEQSYFDGVSYVVRSCPNEKHRADWLCSSRQNHRRSAACK